MASNRSRQAKPRRRVKRRPEQEDARLGRPPRALDPATIEPREVFRRLIESNAEKLQGWIDVVAKEDPDKALDLMVRMAGIPQ